jgi:hypothetical protein
MVQRRERDEVTRFMQEGARKLLVYLDLSAHAEDYSAMIGPKSDFPKTTLFASPIISRMRVKFSGSCERPRREVFAARRGRVFTSGDSSSLLGDRVSRQNACGRFSRALYLLRSRRATCGRRCSDTEARRSSPRGSSRITRRATPQFSAQLARS